MLHVEVHLVVYMVGSKQEVSRGPSALRVQGVRVERETGDRRRGRGSSSRGQQVRHNDGGRGDRVVESGLWVEEKVLVSLRLQQR